MPDFRVIGVTGFPEIRPGDDLAALLADAVLLEDGDVVVVTSKVVSKAEGRLIQVAPGMDREAARQQAIATETRREVARRAGTVIAQTHTGLVLAAAGVDASNVRQDEIALLPVNPDASARRLRDRLLELTGRTVGVVISDTMGRPWRVGQVDLAIGSAGVAPIRDARGTVDSFGAVLEVTEIAVADELASAAELVKGKTDHIPVAVVRGLSVADDGRDARALVRPPSQDWFSLGTAEAHRITVGLRRSVRAFKDVPVERSVVLKAVAAAVTAPAPHHTTPWRFVLVERGKRELLDAMAHEWEKDLRKDGFSDDSIVRRLRRGTVLRSAPYLVVPCLFREGAHAYPDGRRSVAEERMFLLAMGAGIENLLIQLAAEGLASTWVSSTLFCADVVRRVLELDASWEPMGAVAVGYAAGPAVARQARDPEDFTVLR